MKLLFVYNANAGKLNAYIHSAHKIFSPSTYACNLCAITYGILKEEETWKNFREQSDIEMEFLHKDEFQKKYKSKFLSKFELPIILNKEGEALEVFISKERLNTMKTSQQLIKVIIAGKKNS